MTNCVTDNIVVRGCPGSIPGWVLKTEKSNQLIYVLNILYVIYIVYILYTYYIYIYCIYLICILYIYILHIYVESKVTGI